MTKKILRQIVMIEDTLRISAAELGPEKTAKLQAELDQLRAGMSIESPVVTVPPSIPSTAEVPAAPGAASLPSPAPPLRRLTNVAPAARQPRPAPRSAPVTPPPVTFKRLRSGEWGIAGTNLTAAQEVTVQKRDGSQTTVTVGHILWRGPQGETLATIAVR